MNHNESKNSIENEGQRIIDTTLLNRLLRQSVNDFLGNPLNIEQYNSIKKNMQDAIYNVRLLMKSTIVGGEASEYDGLFPEDLNLISDDKIRLAFFRYGSEIERFRVLALNYIQANIIGASSDDLQVIKNGINQLNINELRYLSKSRSETYSFLKNILGVNQLERISLRDLSDILEVNESVLSGMSDVDKRNLGRILEYISTGGVPTDEDIDFIVMHVLGDNISAKKNFLESIHPVFPVDKLLQYGVLNEKTASTIIEHSIDSFFENTGESGFIESGEYEQGKRDLVDIFIRGIESFPIEVRTLEGVQIEKIFNEQELRKYISSSFQRESLDDTEDSTKSQKGIISQLETDAHGNIHASFLSYVATNLWEMDKSGIRKCRIPGIQNAITGSVIAFRSIHAQDNILHYVRIDQVDQVDSEGVHYVSLTNITGPDGSITTGTTLGRMDYETLYRFFEGIKDSRVFSQSEFQERLSLNKDDVFDPINVVKPAHEQLLYDISLEDDNTIDTLEHLKHKLNDLDSSGREYDFRVGLGFTSKDTNGESTAWRIHAIHAHGVEIMQPGGSITSVISFQEFYNTVKEQGFKRFGYVNTDETLINELRNIPNMESGGLSIIDGQFFMEGLDKNNKKANIEVKCFGDPEKEHIITRSVGNGLLEISQLRKSQEKNEQTGEMEEKNEYTGWMTVTYEYFYRYIQDKSLTPSKKPIYKEEHDEHIHVHGSFFSRMVQWTSPYEMYKGSHMVWEAIHHSLEKGSKLNAAKWAMKMGKLLPSDYVKAQLSADVVDASSGIIDKFKGKLRNLNGPLARLKINHFMTNVDSRPEEVMAGILFMMEGYGLLCAEDLAIFQGKDMYFSALLRACGLKPGTKEYADVEAASIKKAKTVSNENITEELKILGLFKTMDGKYDEYPQGALLIKAAGGPGKFQSVWAEGRDGNIEKGKKQTGMLLGARDRVVQGTSDFSTNELNKFFGSMESAAGKSSAPGDQALPFIWCMSNAAETASSDLANRAKNLADAYGYSFHGYAFTRNPELSNTYQETVRLATQYLHDKASPDKKGYYAEALNMLNTMDKLRHDTSLDDDKDNAFRKRFVKVALGFWDKFNKDIHPLLQGNNPWLFVNATKNSTLQKYADRLHQVHGYALSSNKVPNKDLFNIDNYVDNRIFTLDKKNNMYSLDRQIKKCDLDNQGKMDDDIRDKMFIGVVKYMKDLRTTDVFENEAQRKKYFFYHYNEIMEHFRRELGTHITTIASRPHHEIDKFIKSQGYMQDLVEIGIDPGALILGDSDDTKEKAFNNWFTGRKGGSDRMSFLNQPLPDTPGVVDAIIRNTPSSNDEVIRRRA